MSRIVAAVDFSETTPPVVKFSLELAASLGATAEIIHVHETIDAPHYSELTSAATAAIEARLNAIVAEAAPEAPAVPVVRAAVSNRNSSTTQTIVEAAEGALMLVMGQTQSRGLWRFMVGDTTSGVVDQALCPVLVVPANTEYENPSALHLILDENLPTTAARKPFHQLLHRLKSRLNVHRVLAPNSPEREEDRTALLAETAGDYYVDHSGRTLQEYLKTHPIDNPNDWIVLYHRARAKWLRAVNFDPAERVAASATRPALILVDLTQQQADRYDALAES